jgi:hypothetical protein
MSCGDPFRKIALLLPRYATSSFEGFCAVCG